MKHKLIAVILTSLCLFCGYTSTAQAVPIKITINYELDLAFGNTDPTDAILAEAYLDTSTLTGSGIEDIEVDVLDLQFSVRAGTVNSNGQDLTVQTATSGVFARFEDGVFSGLNNGLNIAAVITPSTSFNKELVALGVNGNGDHTLINKIEFCSSCNTPYISVSDAIVTTLAPIPLPGALVLFASGMFLFVRRRRN